MGNDFGERLPSEPADGAEMTFDDFQAPEALQAAVYSAGTGNVTLGGVAVAMARIYGGDVTSDERARGAG